VAPLVHKSFVVNGGSRPALHGLEPIIGRGRQPSRTHSRATVNHSIQNDVQIFPCYEDRVTTEANGEVTKIIGHILTGRSVSDCGAGCNIRRISGNFHLGRAWSKSNCIAAGSERNHDEGRWEVRSHGNFRGGAVPTLYTNTNLGKADQIKQGGLAEHPTGFPLVIIRLPRRHACHACHLIIPARMASMARMSDADFEHLGRPPGHATLCTPLLHLAVLSIRRARSACSGRRVMTNGNPRGTLLRS